MADEWTPGDPEQSVLARIEALQAENARLRADLQIARAERDTEAREAEMWRDRYEELITVQVVVDVPDGEAT